MHEIPPQRAALCLAVGFVAACLAATPALSQPVLGETPERQANSFTSDDQLQVDITAREANGDFVVVWTSYGTPLANGDDDGTSIQGQRYDGSGNSSGEQFQINTASTGNQFLPAVASSEAGGFLVVWMSQASGGDDSDGTSIQAQHYDASGSPTAAEFQVNTLTTSDQYAPDAAVDATGRFVVVWDSASGDADGDSIQARRVDASGVANGAQFLVNDYQTGNQQRPAISSDAAGAFVVVWESEGSPGTDTSLRSVQRRRFDVLGIALGPQAQVNDTTTGEQQHPAVAHGANGNFLVTWESAESSNVLPDDSLDDDSFSIQAQRYDTATGAALDNEFQVNSYTTGGQRYPGVEYDASGNFVVAWDSSGSSGNDSSLYSIQARRFVPDESKGAADDVVADGDDFQVNTFTTTGQSLSAITRRLEADFVIAWQSNGSLGDDSSGYSVQFAPEPGASATRLAAIAAIGLLGRRRQRRR